MAQFCLKNIICMNQVECAFANMSGVALCSPLFHIHRQPGEETAREMLMNSLFRHYLALPERSRRSVSLGATERNKTQVNTKQDGYKLVRPLVIYSPFLIPRSGRSAAIKLRNYMFYQEQLLSPEYWITEIKYE